MTPIRLDGDGDGDLCDGRLLLLVVAGAVPSVVHAVAVRRHQRGKGSLCPMVRWGGCHALGRH